MISSNEATEPDTSISVTKSSKHTCIICNKHFRWKSGLSRHMNLFHLRNSNKTFKCDICNQLFYKQIGLTIHLKQHTRNDALINKINTNLDQESNTRTQKISHLYSNIISETVYSSDSDCEYEILQTITKLCSSDKNFDHTCQECGKNFMKPESLQKHSTRHKEPETLQIPTNDNNLNPSDSEMSERFPCNKCNKQFKQACNLANHQKIHLKQSVMAQKELIRLKPRFSCTFCNKIYFKKMHLENHLFVVHADKKLPCAVCKQMFNAEALEIHKQTKCKIITKPYLCMICGKGYNRSGSLSIHMRTHSNYRPHLCSVCGKSFTIRRYLIVHSRTHTQERPYKCQHCEKGFIQKGNLIEHLRIHSGIKPHHCGICGKCFTHYSGLTQHLLTHNPTKRHMCKVCGKAFRLGGHFREHMRIHSGDRPFVCNVCNRGFASNSSLVVHLRTHSGERPYKCIVCKKGFIKSYGLKQHRKTHSACNVIENTN